MDRDQELECLRRVAALSPGGALDAARHAAAAGQPQAARVLLAGVGGLLDTAEAERVLAEPPHAPPSPALLRALAALPRPPEAPGEREAWVRGQAARLLRRDAVPTVLPPGAGPDLGPGQLHAAPLCACLALDDDETRWTRAVEWALEGARRAGQGRVTLAVSGWGAWLGARELLAERYGALVGGLESPIAVITLEDAVGLLSAAWQWTLPDLAALLDGPVLLDGVQGLPAGQQGMIAGLLADNARVFGTGALLLSPWVLDWPDWPELTAGPEEGRPTTGAPLALPRFAPPETLDLAGLAARMDREPSDTLALLPSRGSAARLAALLPGSVLWSSSLCPVHLGERGRELRARRRAGERLRVVATTLPPAQLGPFETVWHGEAPLPHLAEAWRLCSGTFRRLELTDVARPTAWHGALARSRDLLAQLPPAEALAAYRRLSRGLGAEASGPDLGQLRTGQDYASLAAALRVRPATSRPVLIPYDGAARALAEQARRSGHLPTAALRYAAWLTPTEAETVLRRGQASSLGWALLWEAPYNPDYGLAGTLVRETRYAQEA
ncbi:hypothetical protein [Deinococcus sp. Leaf326]|uniref:hypothetical protein n=1 Tax=Deinococcus sp. Leaf326 TaxID=1736338 RepID=UPI0006FAFB28|nr:hypothetical protein [Deinococcus sp. Leaf326]KQQ97820.1 hypothetical protein ASF71_14455 [Deinococcus sp. Leaf326]